jgi:23S rRNA (guanosine2251-2'-O)-methyltransferase
LKNKKRKIHEVFILEELFDVKKKIINHLKALNKKVKIKTVNSRFFDNNFKNNTKHQGIAILADKLNIESYESIFNNKKFKLGVILESITDPNNVGAIYRSARAFGIEFIINTTKNSANETASLLNTACGAFESINSFKANNISNAVKRFKKNNWWVVGLDHNVSQNINDIAGKISKNDKYVFIFGSEGKGIKRLIKENCNIIASIPNLPNTKSINVSNAAAIVFYEIYKRQLNISKKFIQ